MANLNRVMLIGRLTREPEVKEFNGGGKVANIGFAVNNRRKNRETGEWEEVPVWLTLKAFNREAGRKLADITEQHLHKGQQAFVGGHLALEEWAGKEDGKKHSQLVVYVDSLEFLGGQKAELPAEQGAPAAAVKARTARVKAAAGKALVGAAVSGMEEIPF